MMNFNLIEENGMQFMEMYCPSVAEVVGLAPKGSSKSLRFPIIGFEKDGEGNKVPHLGVKMMSDEKYKRLTHEKQSYSYQLR